MWCVEIEKERNKKRDVLYPLTEKEKFSRPQNDVSEKEIEETWSSELRQRVTKLDVVFFFLLSFREVQSASKITAQKNWSIRFLKFFFLGKTLFRWFHQISDVYRKSVVSCFFFVKSDNFRIFFFVWVRISSISCYTILNYNYSVFSCSFP